MHFEAGKGDSPRPRTSTEAEYTAWYCRNFGHQWKNWKCRNCRLPVREWLEQNRMPPFPPRHTS